MKHAFLIMAHENIEILNILLQLLDDSNNDIYIHVDRKTKKYNIRTVKKSNIFICKQRYNIRWGNETQIKLELYLFSEAYSHGPYAYYHLLSGVDLPIKSNQYIHDFFEKEKGKEFVGFVPMETMPKEVFKAINYHFFTNHLKDKTNRWTKLHWKLIDFQIKHHISRKPKHDYRKGSNWVSITNDFVGYLLTYKKQILNEYRFTFGCDEIFLQTILWNSPYRNKIYDVDNEFKSSVRKIDWKRGSPYIWKESDYDELMSSNAIFARKFDLENIKVVNRIRETLLENKDN